MFCSRGDEANDIFEKVTSVDEQHRQLIRSTVGTMRTNSKICSKVDRLGLSSGDDRLARRVLRALCNFTGRDDIKPMMFVSQDDADDDCPWWMQGNSYIQCRIKSSENERLAALLKRDPGFNAAGKSLFNLLWRTGESDNLPRAITDACGNLRWQCTNNETPIAPGKPLFGQVFSTTLDALLLATLMNDAETAKHADQMAALLRWTIPLRERKSLPGTWMCLWPHQPNELSQAPQGGFVYPRQSPATPLH